MLEGLFNRVASLSDGDTFSPSMDSTRIFLKRSKFTSEHMKVITNDGSPIIGLRSPSWLVKALLPHKAIIILDSDGECQWDGAWTYDSTTGQWEAPEVTIYPDLNSTLSSVGPFKSSVDYSIDGDDDDPSIDALLTTIGQAVVSNMYLD